MKIFNETKEIAQQEKLQTRKLLNKLQVIDRGKLYCDLQYSSLFQYIVKELKYSQAEAVVRVNAVRFMSRSRKAKKAVEQGDVSLSNAASANKILEGNKDKQKENRILKEKPSVQPSNLKL